MDPKTEPKIGPKSHNPGRQISYKDANKDVQTRSCQSVVCAAILFNCEQLSQKGKGSEGRRSCSNKGNIFLHLQFEHGQDTLYCRRYRLKCHTWENQQHARYCIYIYVLRCTCLSCTCFSTSFKELMMYLLHGIYVYIYICYIVLVCIYSQGGGETPLDLTLVDGPKYLRLFKAL